MCPAVATCCRWASRSFNPIKQTPAGAKRRPPGREVAGFLLAVAPVLFALVVTVVTRIPVSVPGRRIRVDVHPDDCRFAFKVSRDIAQRLSKHIARLLGPEIHDHRPLPGQHLPAADVRLSWPPMSPSCACINPSSRCKQTLMFCGARIVCRTARAFARGSSRLIALGLLLRLTRP